jgi:hypothetical protein
VKDKEKSVGYFIEDFHLSNLSDGCHFTEHATRILIRFLAIFRKEILLPNITHEKSPSGLPFQHLYSAQPALCAANYF